MRWDGSGRPGWKWIGEVFRAGRSGGASARVMNFFWMGLHQQLEAHQVQVTLRPAPGEAGQRGHTEVTMVADLRPGVRRNVRTSQWTAAFTGGGAGALTAAVIAKGTAVLASVAALAPAAVVAVGVAAASILAYRRIYPRVLAKAEGEMRRALTAISAAVQSETVFGVLPGPGTTQRGTPDDGDDGAAAVLLSS